ncbi:MAG: LytR/AlgR family response regulator transcription factor [Aestuariibaculum sp.]
MNCIIIDDDDLAIEIMQNLCKLDQTLNVKACFSNAIDAIKYLSAHHDIDVIFLDIHMPSFTGFDLIKTLNPPLRTILTTSDKNLAINAFEYNYIIDYLAKPIEAKRFLKAIEKLKTMHILNEGHSSKEPPFPKKLFVNINRKLVSVTIAEINFIEAKGDYIILSTSKNSIIVHSSLKKIQDRLPNKTFIKVHRSYIINIEKIIDIEDNSVLIHKTLIPVSRSHRKILLNHINLL